MARTVAPERALPSATQLQDIVRALDRNPGRTERWIAEQLVNEYGHRRNDADHLVELAAERGLLVRGPDGLLDIADETGKMRDRITQALNGPPDDSYLDSFFEHANLELTGDPADIVPVSRIVELHKTWIPEGRRPSYTALAKAIERLGVERAPGGRKGVGRVFAGVREKPPSS